MRSFRHALGLALALTAAAYPSTAPAQQQAQGFALERLYPSAPGGGWFVMDALDMQGGLGGALELTVGYANNPLVVAGGATRLGVVSDQAMANIGAAVTYERWRFYANVDSPLAIRGQSGVVGDYAFTAPTLTLASNPDLIPDARLGADVRLLGDANWRFRLGASAQVYVPFGNRADYDTDGTWRAMFRALAAGDMARFTYAAQLGVHIRPLDDSPTPGSPQGSELLFGVAAGAKLNVGSSWRAVVGPEVYGQSALRALLGAGSTGLETLLSGRLEGTGSGSQFRFKVGLGGGLDPHFGTPEWRLVVAIELFGHQGLDSPVAPSAANAAQ